MKYILFILLFSTPPAPHVDTPTRKAKAVWALKSSTSMEFATLAACKVNGQTILDSLDTTDTVTGTGWCFCESAPGGTCPDETKADEKFKSSMTSKSIKPLDFSVDGTQNQSSKVDLGAVPLLPRSLQDAKRAAETNSLRSRKRE